jgi:predicted O-methyltransferase YrrM
MRLVALLDAVKAMNLAALRLALRNVDLAASYMSRCLQLYDEMTGYGLESRSPVDYIVARGWGEIVRDERILLPTQLNDTGGTRPEELLCLANVTKVLRPRKIFEIGTFSGRTTSIFIMNAPRDTVVITLDLPPETKVPRDPSYIDTDIDLVRRRPLARHIHELGLESRCQQILSDSMEFDPTPHEGTVELGFIDGAHSHDYVKNDTEKMLRMITDRGMVMWHDYGGKGRFRPLSEYLHTLAKRVPIYRAPHTSLAWAAGSDLRRLTV